MARADKALPAWDLPPSPSWLPFLVPALLLHCAILGLLLLARDKRPRSSAPPTPVAVAFRLIPPPEGTTPFYIASSSPDALPPVGSDTLPDFETKTGGEQDTLLAPQENTLDGAELAAFLAEERERLRAELDRLQNPQLAEALPVKLPSAPRPSSGPRGAESPGPPGAIRELDLEGYPQKVTDQIMQRYGLRVVKREIKAGFAGQNFLSSASRGGSDRYFGGMVAQAGVYEIFQLSRQSVAHMSRMEEKAIRDRGMDPMKTQVIKIVFGIVKGKDGEYDLGVKSLKAEAME